MQQPIVSTISKRPSFIWNNILSRRRQFFTITTILVLVTVGILTLQWIESTTIMQWKQQQQQQHYQQKPLTYDSIQKTTPSLSSLPYSAITTTAAATELLHNNKYYSAAAAATTNNKQRIDATNTFLRPNRHRRHITLSAHDNTTFLRILYLSPTKRFGFCAPPKNACTSWRILLATIENLPFNSPNDIHNRSFPFIRGDKLPLKEAEAILNDPSWTFITMIRNPYERFASAFFDKIAREETDPAKKRYCLYFLPALYWKFYYGIPTQSIQCPISLDDFLKIMYNTPTRYHNEHFLPQTVACAHGRMRYDEYLTLNDLQNTEFMKQLLTSMKIDSNLWPGEELGASHRTNAKSRLCELFPPTKAGRSAKGLLDQLLAPDLTLLNMFPDKLDYDWNCDESNSVSKNNNNQRLGGSTTATSSSLNNNNNIKLKHEVKKNIKIINDDKSYGGDNEDNDDDAGDDNRR
jgi:hypothetical protein